MTLVELCDTLFQYMARLNRGARKGASADMAQVRGDINGLFAQMRTRAAAEPGLVDQYDKISFVLMYFVDFMVKESRLGFAREWKPLAYEVNKLAGEEDFFDELDRTLKEPDTESSRGRLAVFYVCMGMGFTGWYTGNPEHLKQKMNEIKGRIHAIMDLDKGKQVCPEAYANVNTKDLTEKPVKKLVGVAIVLAGLTVTVLVANGVFYQSSRRAIADSVTELNGLAAPAAASKEGTR